MANPTFPSNAQGERVDAVIDENNNATLKLGIGGFTPTGGTTNVAWTGAATHVVAEAIAANDGVMVAAGGTISDVVTPLAVDAGGGLKLANYVEAPSDLAATATTGTLGASTYSYKVSATTGAGESLPSTAVTLSVSASGGVILTWTIAPGATGYKVYGRTTASYLLMATISSGYTTTWTDTGSVTPSGTPPTTNTAIRSSGTSVSVGGAAVGSTATGNPVLVGVKDTAGNAQYAYGDTTGRLIIVGGAASGSAAAGNPVLTAGTDGTNARSLLTDTSGRMVTVGAAADGAAVTGNPVLIAGQDGTNTQSILTDTTGAQLVGRSLPSRTTYVATVVNVSISATTATQVLVIEAPSAANVYISRFVLVRSGVAGTADEVVNYALVRTTAASSGGSAITPQRLDPADAAYGGVVRSLPSTLGTVGATLYNYPVLVPKTTPSDKVYEVAFEGQRLAKMPVIAAGTANGIALYVASATNAITGVSAFIEFVV